MSAAWQETAPRCSAGVSLHLLEEEGLLFDEPAQALVRLNGTATALWCLLADGETLGGLVRFLTATHGMPDATAEVVVAETLSDWRGRGLLDRAGKRSCMRAQQQAIPLPGPACADAPFRLYRRCGALCLMLGWHEAALTADITGTVAHLPPILSEEAEACLEVIAGDGGYLVLADAEPVGPVATADAVACWLRAGLIRLLARYVPHLLALHAAALGRDGGCLLLPASSGTGKTTLAAALCAAGWRYLADDVTLLEGGTLAALPVPTPLAVKQGAVPLLTPFYPELAALPEMRSDDGRIVRHLPPPAMQVSHVAMPVRWIVFPARNGQGGSPSPLSPADALLALMAMCEAVPRAFTSADIAALIGWIQGVACFRLPVGALEPTIARIRMLTRDRNEAAGASRGGARHGPAGDSELRPASMPDFLSPRPADCRSGGIVSGPRHNLRGEIGHGA